MLELWTTFRHLKYFTKDLALFNPATSLTKCVGCFTLFLIEFLKVWLTTDHYIIKVHFLDSCYRTEANIFTKSKSYKRCFPNFFLNLMVKFFFYSIFYDRKYFSKQSGLIHERCIKNPVMHVWWVFWGK